MNDNLSEIVCIIDRSGSMHAIESDAIGGFNAFLEEQKKQPGQANFTLVLFNNNYQLVHDNVEIQHVADLNENTYRTGGSTALLDAVGRTIDEVGERLAQTPEPERPGKVIVAILTDGLENASQEYSRRVVAEMIKQQQEVYSWEFIFLAANQDAIATASTMNIHAKDAHSFKSTGEGIRTANVHLSRIVSERRSRRKDD